uniref:Uncharacterized protein LOC104241145 n=1 Tax=Nicotiana sylvestris TaxID=4096 RepID=A0A1U7XXN4_NICSY|nr:PREDICTED: uncharacterized protein LOC104241145 [Nicotiana sylvestris]
MDAKIDDKVKLGVKAYLESLGITIGSNRKLCGDEQVSDNSMDNHQQSLSPVSLVHTKMVNIIKKAGVSEVGTKKKKRVSLKKLQGSCSSFSKRETLHVIVCKTYITFISFHLNIPFTETNISEFNPPLSHHVFTSVSKKNKN